MGEGSNAGTGVSPAFLVFNVDVPEEIQEFLESKKLTAKVIEEADKDIRNFPGSNRDSIEISRTKATIASVFYLQSIKPEEQDKETYTHMFRLICQDIVRDMHEEGETLRGKERK